MFTTARNEVLPFPLAFFDLRPESTEIRLLANSNLSRCFRGTRSCSSDHAIFSAPLWKSISDCVILGNEQKQFWPALSKCFSFSHLAHFNRVVKSWWRGKGRVSSTDAWNAWTRRWDWGWKREKKRGFCMGITV